MNRNTLLLLGLAGLGYWWLTRQPSGGALGLLPRLQDNPSLPRFPTVTTAGMRTRALSGVDLKYRNLDPRELIIETLGPTPAGLLGVRRPPRVAGLGMLALMDYARGR